MLEQPLLLDLDPGLLRLQGALPLEVELQLLGPPVRDGLLPLPLLGLAVLTPRKYQSGETAAVHQITKARQPAL